MPSPRPNIRISSLDLYGLEQQVGGIEPGEFLSRKAPSHRKETLLVLAFYIALAVSVAFWIDNLYRLTMVVFFGEGGGR